MESPICCECGKSATHESNFFLPYALEPINQTNPFYKSKWIGDPNYFCYTPFPTFNDCWGIWFKKVVQTEAFKQHLRSLGFSDN